MSAVATPIALTISVKEANVATLPAALEARLVGSPTKTPTELANDLKISAEKTAALRKAHLDAVRDRAARESQRAAEAAARKLRLANSKVDKIQRKIEAATNKMEVKKQANDAERSAKKAHREELALAVAEARAAAVTTKSIRAAELAAAEKAAFAKHAKSISTVQTKGAVAVKHALAVASAHKEKLEADKTLKSEALESKLNAAELRRESRQHAAASSSPTRTHAGTHDVAHRVLNDTKVACETRRKLFAEEMAKHEAKRVAHLSEIQGKARKENAKAEAVVSKHKAAKAGTDAATASARHLYYEKLHNAEVARLQALKAKYLALKPFQAAMQGDTVSAIVVRMDDVLAVRPPPAELIKRLAVKGASLLATAKSRQAGAKSRRALAAHATLAKICKANERRAAALSKLGKAAAKTAADAAAKRAQAVVTLALVQGKRAHVLEHEAKKALALKAKRAQYDEGLARVGALNAATASAAAERRAKVLRGIAKAGVAAVRFAASKSRREALGAKLAAAGAAKQARCDAAAAKKAEHLAARVELAKKRMVAKHPKHEAEDMEIVSGIEG